jgi:hypothetical protein
MSLQRWSVYREALKPEVDLSGCRHRLAGFQSPGDVGVTWTIRIGNADDLRIS